MAFDADDSGDEGFDEDIEAIRRACFLSGTDPKSLHHDSAAAESEDEDDFELVRGIRQRFNACCSEAGEDAPLTLKPLSVLLPSTEDDDDDEDDFGILRRIQKRFSCYDQDADGLENSQEKQEHVRSKNTYPEKGTSDSVELDKTNASKADPDSLDLHNTSDTQESFDRATPDTFPSCLTEAHETDIHDLTMVPTEGCGFPKAAQMFVEAIRKNRACQKFIRNKMMQTEARIEENKKLQHRVKILRDFQLKCKKQTANALSRQQDARIQLISASKPKGKAKQANQKKDSALCYGPAENSHVACYKMVLAEYQVSLSRRKWTGEERQNLAKGIKQQFQELLLQRSVDSISEMVGDSDDVDSIYASIRKHDITSEHMRLFLPKVNWERLASMYVKGRSGAECEARWLNWEDPLINRKPWTNLEDKKLLHIVQQRGISNWIEIAVLLETNRTPFQCLARYQRSLNASVIRSEWSKDEDEKLCAAVATLGESNWENVAATLVGRTGPQCSNRWIKSLNPARKKTGKWSLDEDKRVKVAVIFFGPKNWRKIAQFVPGRTHVQCRERWANNLDPSLNLGEWTEEEDSKLKAAIGEIGYCWSKVAACVSSRTDNQCTRRWKTLFPHEVPLLQAARKIQKAALISNFVDRESERPALGPKDFIPLRLTNAVSGSEELNQSAKQRRKPRPKKVTKEAQSCSDEVMSTTDVDVEKDSGKKTNLKKKLTTRRCKRKKEAFEPTEDSRISQEIVSFAAETTKKRVLIRRKRASRFKKAIKEALTCSEEILLTDAVHVENVAGEKTNSKKKPRLPRRKKSNGASEATADTTVGEETLPFDRETKKNTPSKQKTALRSKKATKQALIYTDKILLANGVDFEKVAGERTKTKKKPKRQQCMNTGASEAAEDARVVQGFVPFGGETKKKKTPRKLKMALREEPKEKDRAATSRVDSLPDEERLTEPSQKKTRTGSTNSHMSTCGDSEVLNVTNIEEVEEHIGYRMRAENKRSSEKEKKGQCKRFDEAASSFDANEAFSEVQKFTSPHLEQDRHADPTEVNSSPCRNSKSLRTANVNGAEKSANGCEASVLPRPRRIKCSTVLCEVSDTTEISDSETLGGFLLLKKREMRRSLKKQSGLKHSSIKSVSVMRKEVDAVNERECLEINRAGENVESSAHEDSCSHGKRKGHRPRAGKSKNVKLGNKFDNSTNRGGKRKRSSIDERLPTGPELGEEMKDVTLASLLKKKRRLKRSSIDEQLPTGPELGEEMKDVTLASLLKKIQKKRRLNLAPTTPPLGEFSNEPSRIGWL